MGRSVIARSSAESAAHASVVLTLVELLLNVCRLGMDLRDRVSELDLNPVRVLHEGHGVVALDALVVRK